MSEQNTGHILASKLIDLRGLNHYHDKLIEEIDSKYGGSIDSVKNLLVNITYSELKSKRDSGQLVPGAFYRIIDYITTTSQADTQSAFHQFDLIVTADDNNKLNEKARAIQHEGDTYFRNSDLNAWEVWYCLDNDSERFDWAGEYFAKCDDLGHNWLPDSVTNKVINIRIVEDEIYLYGDKILYVADAENGEMYFGETYIYDESERQIGTYTLINGKGVIYRMIDEFGNDCPYDFKNIQFIRYELNAPETFDTEPWMSQLSVNIQAQFNNNALPYIWGGFTNGANRNWEDNFEEACSTPTGSKKAFYTFSTVIDGIVTDHSLLQGYCYDNTMQEYIPSKRQTLNNNVFLNTSKTSYCYSNSFGNNCYSNTFGNNCYSNSFGNFCYCNSFGNTCYSNSFGNFCYCNSFGNNCYSNTFGNTCYSNSFGNFCYYNSFGNNCRYNSFGNFCYCNSFGNTCTSNSFGDDCRFNSFVGSCGNNSFVGSCSSNSFGDSCSYNSFGDSCSYNSFGNNCSSNTFGKNCQYNSFGNNCSSNTFGKNCQYNSFGNNCRYNSFGNFCYCNSFGNECHDNSFRVSASKSSSLKDYVRYNHFDDGCSYNVIWNGDTTSDSMLLKNININRGVVGTSRSYNYINVNTLNSEKEININNYNGRIYIDYEGIFNVKYNELLALRNNSKLIPGRQYRIIDYVTTTSQTNTQSAGHPFDIVVTALTTEILSEEAQAVQDFDDGYFDESNLSAWKLWYCLDNDTNRFAWAGDELITSESVEVTIHDSSECTIKSELINGNEFITPFNFESCVWVDASGDNEAYGDESNHDEAELVYEWGYFTDDDDNTHLCLYKSDADLYEEEGQPDYGDKYLYRGVVTVDGTDYDYWQKWDAADESINITENGDHVYATTPRIVANPNALSVETTNKTVETIIQLNPKGVIYRMIDEFGNDCPYDFKNIQFKHPKDTTTYPDYYYTFSTVINGIVTDHSLIKGYCYGNTMKEYINSKKQQLNNNVFINTSKTSYCHSNTFVNNCYDNSFGNSCSRNSFGNSCSRNSFGNQCQDNHFGNNCYENSFGNECRYNSFGNDCYDNSFRASANEDATLKDYVQYNHFDDGCSFNVIWNSDTTNSSVLLKNINVNRGVSGTSGSYNYINITTLNQDYEIQVAKNSKGEIKIYCEADLIA